MCFCVFRVRTLEFCDGSFFCFLAGLVRDATRIDRGGVAVDEDLAKTSELVASNPTQKKETPVQKEDKSHNVEEPG